MAAKIVVIRDEKTWNTVNDVLGDLDEGGIIIPPEECARLDENMPDWEEHLGGLIDYDFGGEPDILIDVARDGNFASTTIDDILIPIQARQHEDDTDTGE